MMPAAWGVKEKVIAYHMADRCLSATEDRKRYHHGDLRRHLLRIARKEIVRHGAQSVSLASLARLAGVSQPAPYRHFADRDALLEAVAAQVFEELAHKLSETTASKSPDEALRNMAATYVVFGERNVELYRLMFASHLTPEAKSGSELDESAEQAFAVFRTALSQRLSRKIDDCEAYLFWAQLHGLVMLKADGFIKRSLIEYVRDFGSPNKQQNR